MIKNKLAVQEEKSVLTPEQMNLLEEKLPKWVRELANDGTAVLRWNQEFLILIEELLRKDHGFSESDLVKLEKRIKEMLPHLHKMALEDLVILRPKDMQTALDIVDTYKQIENKQNGIALPTKEEVKKIGGKI